MFQMAIRMKREKHGFPFCNCLELKEQQSSDSRGHNYMFNWLAVPQKERTGNCIPFIWSLFLCVFRFHSLSGDQRMETIGLSVWAVIPTNPLQTFFPDYKSLSDGETLFLLPTDVSWRRMGGGQLVILITFNLL